MKLAPGVRSVGRSEKERGKEEEHQKFWGLLGKEQERLEDETKGKLGRRSISS